MAGMPLASDITLTRIRDEPLAIADERLIEGIRVANTY